MNKGMLFADFLKVTEPFSIAPVEQNDGISCLTSHDIPGIMCLSLIQNNTGIRCEVAGNIKPQSRFMDCHPVHRRVGFTYI